jgi:hypothetical protein
LLGESNTREDGGPVERDGDDCFVGPVPVELLADLQAGLLDDHTAACLRRRARTDAEVAARLAALDRVRRDLADLGRDAASAPGLPPDLTARIGAALRRRRPSSGRGR